MNPLELTLFVLFMVALFAAVAAWVYVVKEKMKSAPAEAPPGMPGGEPPAEKEKSETWRALVSGSKRTYMLLALGIALTIAAAFVPPEGLYGMGMRALMAIGALCVCLAVGERVRRAVAPYVDLRALVEKAKTEATGAAIVAGAVLYFYAAVIVSLMQVFQFK